nr:cyclin-dependent kinase inhibitor 1C-like [Aegilops tauschii subsp. strangulata]
MPHTASPARAQRCLAPGLPCLPLPLLARRAPPLRRGHAPDLATASAALLPSPPATAQASPCHRCPFPASGPSPWPRPTAAPPSLQLRLLVAVGAGAPLLLRRPAPAAGARSRISTRGLGDSAPAPARA